MAVDDSGPNGRAALTPDLPFDFVVFGTAVSAQASRRDSISAWKSRVAAAARSALPEGAWLITEPLAITIYIYPRTQMQGDLDNRIKPILDAMVRCVYEDDVLVERIVAQKFEPGRPLPFLSPSAALLTALASTEPTVYIRISRDLSEEVANGPNGD